MFSLFFLCPDSLQLTVIISNNWLTVAFKNKKSKNKNFWTTLNEMKIAQSVTRKF